MGKVPCLRCNEDILLTTAEKTGGRCMPCWKEVVDKVSCRMCKLDTLPTTAEQTGGYCMLCWKEVERIAFDGFINKLKTVIDESKLEKSMSMLRKESFQLFSEITDGKLAGVVKSQTDPNLIYGCYLCSDGSFSCCTQNLKACGGLRGSLCKHLLVLLIGLSRVHALNYEESVLWCTASLAARPELDKGAMTAIFLKYKGAEAGQIDWRPTETMPEDYYSY